MEKCFNALFKISFQSLPSSFIGRYRISYGRVGFSSSSFLLSRSYTTYTIRGLSLGTNYSLQIRSESLISGSTFGGNCRYVTKFPAGKYSKPLYAVPVEKGPISNKYDHLYVYITYIIYICIHNYTLSI